jgi:hypothetical protein
VEKKAARQGVDIIDWVREPTKVETQFIIY